MFFFPLNKQNYLLFKLNLFLILYKAFRNTCHMKDILLHRGVLFFVIIFYIYQLHWISIAPHINSNKLDMAKSLLALLLGPTLSFI